MIEPYRVKRPQYANDEMEKRIRNLIHDDEDQEMLILKHIHGKTLMEISDLQKRPYSTVRDHYYRQSKLLFESTPGSA